MFRFLLICLCLQGLSAESFDLTQREWLENTLVVCEDVPVSKADLSRLFRCSKDAEPEATLAKIIVATAVRRQQGGPLVSLRWILPQLIPANPEGIAEFCKEQERNSLPCMGEAAAVVSRLLPLTETWLPENMEVVPEAIRALAMCDRSEEALLFGARMVQSLTRPSMVGWRCLEACGDVLRDRGDVLESVRAYRAAITTWGASLCDGETSVGASVREATALELAWKRRLDLRLKQAQSERDIAQYGKAFCLFRQGEEHRLANRHVDAVLVYNVLIAQFPETIFACCAQIRRAECLGMAANDASGIAERLNAEMEKLRGIQASLAASRFPNPSPARTSGVEDMRRQQAVVDGLKAIPKGSANMVRASLSELAALADEPSHPFAGEALISLGDARLENGGDGKAAREYYHRAEVWITNVRQGQAGSREVSVPAQAIVVSAPPLARRTMDAFGASGISVPDAGVIISAKTCAWYVNALQERVLLRMGLASLVSGNREEAAQAWRKLYDMDSFYAEREAQGFGSVVQRVLFDLEYQNGGLYAKDSEIAAFTNGARRARVLMADLSFEAGEFADAARGYRRLLADDAISHAETGYCVYALAVCRAMDGAWPEARKLLARFDDDLVGTPSHPRALYFRIKTVMGAATVTGPDEDLCRADLAYLLKAYPNTQEADAALHCMAWIFAGRRRLVESKQLFQEYVRRYPSGLWGAAAIIELDEVVAALAATTTPKEE